jgi:hypothetical protein
MGAIDKEDIDRVIFESSARFERCRNDGFYNGTNLCFGDIGREVAVRAIGAKVLHKLLASRMRIDCIDATGTGSSG